MPNAKPPSTLSETSEEPSQSTVQISLLTHANALNHVFPLKAFDTGRAQPGLPPVRFSHLHLHQQLFTGNYRLWDHSLQLRLSRGGGGKTPSARSPQLAVLLCTLPGLTSRGCPCDGSRCVPGVGGERGGITVSLAGSGVPGWWEGWTMGTRTSPQSPAPPVQRSTPARSPRTAIYNRTATMASSAAVKWCTSLTIRSPG